MLPWLMTNLMHWILHCVLLVVVVVASFALFSSVCPGLLGLSAGIPLVLAHFYLWWIVHSEYANICSVTASKRYLQFDSMATTTNTSSMENPEYTKPELVKQA